jgi:uncharacterized membrane protein HdeD (DUF308 family)
MHCKRNVGRTQRVVRVALGVVAIAGGLLLTKDVVVGYSIAAMGGMLLMTGIIGFCPACAVGSGKSADAP